MQNFPYLLSRRLACDLASIYQNCCECWFWHVVLLCCKAKAGDVQQFCHCGSILRLMTQLWSKPSPHPAMDLGLVANLLSFGSLREYQCGVVVTCLPLISVVRTHAEALVLCHTFWRTLLSCIHLTGIITWVFAQILRRVLRNLS